MRRKVVALAFSLVLMLTISAGCSSTKVETKSYQKTIATARTEIWNAIAAQGASSATIAIIDNGNIVYKEGFAMADRAASLSVADDTQFNICSISKIFTAAAILQLCEEGKLELDKPVVDYMPEFTMPDSRYKDITVRMLLNHTAAFPGTYAYNAETTEPDASYTEQFMTYLAGTQLNGDPGKVSVYCNDCFTFGEILVEKVSGQSFSDYLNKHIFNKADMKNSSCNFKAGNTNIALKYNEDGSAAPVEYINSLGSGGISSTAVDLCRYAQALLQGKIINEAMLTEYTSPQYGTETVPSGTPLYPYGLGWDSVSVPDFELQGVRVMGKNGGSPQYNSQLYVLPDENIAVAIIFAGNADVTTIANDIVQSIVDENGLNQINEIAAAIPTDDTIPESIMSYAGIYGDGSAIMKVDFNKEKNTLVYKKYSNGGFVTQGEYPYQSDGTFHLPVGYRIGFEENFGKKLLVIHGALTDGSIVSGQKLEAADASQDTSQFKGKSWIPTNLSSIDANTISCKTGVLTELPGYIYYSTSGAYTPYALKDASTAKMVLPYGKDLAQSVITQENGKTILTVMNYKLMDVADVVSLQKDEPISIGGDGRNVCRKLDSDGPFRSDIPAGGRIVIYDSNLQAIYDSTISETGRTEVTAGSYILFIGKPGDAFSYDYPV